MTNPARRPNRVRILLWVGIAACLGFLLWVVPARAGQLLYSGDAILFWASGRLALAGENPYDEAHIVEVLAQAGHPADFGAEPMPHMLYPPWALPVVMPFGLLGYPAFRLVWLALNLAVIALAAHLTWKLYGGSSRLAWLPFLLALTFAPTGRVVSIGNPAPLMLLGVVPFLALVGSPSAKPSRGKDLLAGALLLLATLKPPLAYLFLAAVGLWVLYQRRWMVLLGAATSLGLATLAALAFNPAVIGQYFQAMGSYPLGAWATPTVGALLRLALGVDTFWLQYLPSLLGLAWLAVFWLLRRQDWDWLRVTPLLLAVSLVSAAYAWTYDLVLLAVPLVAAAAGLLQGSPRRMAWGLGVYAVLNLIVLVLYTRLSDFWLFWLAPAFLIWLVWAQRGQPKKA